MFFNHASILISHTISSLYQIFHGRQVRPKIYTMERRMFKNILKWLASHFLRHSLIATKKQKLPFDLRNKVLRHFTRSISFINYWLLIPFNFIACSERASLLWRTVRHSFFSGVGLSETLLYMVRRLVFGNIARNKKTHAIQSIIKYLYLRPKKNLISPFQNLHARKIKNIS